jgi:hypothetical protein
MTDLVSTVHLVLRGAEYNTWPVGNGDESVIGFEDEVVMGFVRIFADATELLSRWEEAESGQLGRYAGQLRTAGEKAWNFYSVFLTSAAATEDERREIRWIEENLDRTRKLAAAGLITREDVVDALLPLLPIVARPVMEIEAAGDRLTKRISLIAPQVGADALNEEVKPIDVARRLGGKA